MEEEIKQLLSLRLKTLKAKYRSHGWVLAIVALLSCTPALNFLAFPIFSTPNLTFFCYNRDFRKIRKDPMGYTGARENLIHEKKLEAENLVSGSL
jgi:hypothetical protein